MSNLKKKIAFSWCVLVLISSSVMSEEVNSQNTKEKKKAAPLIIQSQVKGSQEQPKVIYIMPWQGVDKVIAVKGKQRSIKLPHFNPINPRDFREQVRFFVNQAQISKPEASQ